MGQGTAGKVRVKKMREEIERKSERGWMSVTSAITSSEMHLDTVSICQNKAASTAASLMAMDVSDRGVGRGGERHTSLLLHVHTQITHAYTGITVRTLFLFAANHWYQICTKLQCNSYWTILTFAHERVRSRVCVHSCTRLCWFLCASAVCACLPSNCGFWLSDTFHHLSLWWIGCCVNQSSELFFFPLLLFFKALWAELCSLSISLSPPFSQSCCLCTRNIHKKSS